VDGGRLRAELGAESECESVGGGWCFLVAEGGEEDGWARGRAGVRWRGNGEGWR
jgi:hypothetical protein